MHTFLGVYGRHFTGESMMWLSIKCRSLLNNHESPVAMFCGCQESASEPYFCLYKPAFQVYGRVAAETHFSLVKLPRTCIFKFGSIVLGGDEVDAIGNVGCVLLPCYSKASYGSLGRVPRKTCNVHSFESQVNTRRVVKI
jgi:hypothetical protein